MLFAKYDLYHQTLNEKEVELNEFEVKHHFKYRVKKML